MLVAVAELTKERITLKLALSLATVVSKLFPVIVTEVPAAPIVGVNAVIVGAPVAPAETLNEVALVADPIGLVTAIGPVVAPLGTLVTISVVLAETTVAAVPLKVKCFCTAVALKRVPKILTEAPARPLLGVNCKIDTCEGL